MYKIKYKDCDYVPIQDNVEKMLGQKCTDMKEISMTVGIKLLKVTDRRAK